MSSRRRVDVYKHQEGVAQKNAEHSTLLTSLNTSNDLTNTKLDNLSGAVNNNLGDAQVKLQTYVYAHSSAEGLARPLKCDTSGRLECSVDALEVTAETINLNTDTLETLIGTTNTKIQTDLDFAGQPNAIGDGSDMKRVMNYGHDSSGGAQRPLKIDADGHLQVDCLSSAIPTGAATETTLAAAEVHLGNIETAAQLIDDTVTVQSAAHPSKAFAVGGRYYVDNTFRDIRVDNIGKVIIDTPTGSDLDTRLATIGTNTTGLAGCVAGSELQVDVVSMPTTTISGTVTANLSATDNAVLDAIAVDGDNIQTKLDTLESSLTSMEGKQDDQETTLNAIQTAVELIDNCISGSEAQVDVVGSLPAGSNTIGKVNVGTFDSAITVNAGTNLNTSALATQSTLADAEAHLGNIETAVQLIDNAISGSEMQVDVVASLPAGTNAIGKLAANSGVDIGDVDVTSISAGTNRIGMVGVKGNEAADGSGTERHLLCDSAGHLQVDVLSAPSSAVTNAGTFAVQVDGSALTSLQLIDDVVKTEDAAHSNGDKGVHMLAVRKDTQTIMSSNDADYTSLQVNGTNALRVHNNKVYTSETSYISGQTVSGSGTHTGGAVTNDANISYYMVEHNFSGSDVSFEVLESIDNSNFFATGQSFNQAGDPTSGLTGINSMEIRSPFFKIKFTNGNGSSRDVTLSYVAIVTA